MAFRKLDITPKQVKDAFKAHNKNYSKTAEALKISVSTVKKYLQK